MLDFGLLPPEITSARMYSGPGSEPTMVAASAWDALAAELDSFAKGYASTISSLQDEGWLGPASNAMAAAAAPFAQWAAATAGRAEQAGSQARAAAAAFAAAHAAVVPPAVVAANRTRLANLIATNILGQNAAQIAATEAAYDAMWMQDAAAMHGYATSASSATKLAPFTGPPPTTNPAEAPAASAAPAAAAASQSSLSQFLSTVPQLLSAAPGTSSQAGIPIPQSFITLMNDLNYIQRIPDIYGLVQARNVGAVGDAIILGVKFMSDGALFSPPSALTEATSPATAAAGSPTILAATAGAGVDRAVLVSVGEATAVGQLSAPQTWANATPVAAATDQYLSSWAAKGAWEAAPKVNVAGTAPAAAMGPMAGAAGAAAARKVVRPSVSAILQVTPPRYRVPRPSSGG